MTTTEVLRANIRDAARGIAYIDMHHQNPVARHAFQSIMKRCEIALEEENIHVPSYDSNNGVS